MWIDERGSEVLGVPECRRLLAVGAKQHRPGHLGVPEDGAPTVLPVDYSANGPDPVIRVGEGLYEHIVGKLVAFQVDGTDDGRAWSVLVKGPAVPEEAEDVAPRLPAPRVAEPGHRLVRIRADVTTGRRLAKAAGGAEHRAS